MTCDTARKPRASSASSSHCSGLAARVHVSQAMAELMPEMDALDARREAKQAAGVTATAGPKRKTKNIDGVIRISGVVHPAPNSDKLARVLLDVAKQMARADAAGRRRHDDDKQVSPTQDDVAA